MRPITKLPVLILSGLLIAATAVFIAVQMASGAEHTPGQAWVVENINEYRQTLAVSDDPAHQQLMQSKLAQMEAIEANRIEALKNAPAKPEDICVLAPAREAETAVERVEGILDSRNAPFNPEEFTANNQWQGPVSGGWVRVYAGGHPDQRDLGILWVVVDNSPDFGSYPSPGTGALRIIGAENGRLTLEGSGGDRLDFDLGARRFLSSPDEVAATLVPLPTFTPAPVLCP